MKTKLYVFFGGRSVEHDVSIVTGLQALENVDKSKYDAYPIYIARDGQWYTGEKLTDVSVYKQFDPKKCGAVPIRLSSVPGEGMVVRQTRKARFGAVEEYDAVLPVDVALLCMHGLHGEDGSLQGMLEMSDIPYTSTSIGASASGMDKALMKKIFCGCGFPNPIYVDFTRFEWEHDQQAIINDINEKISYPLYVKPANLGSSIGISRVTQSEALEEAIRLALAYDRRIVVEKGVPNAKEINCSVIGYGSDCEASLCEEPTGWQDYLKFEDKYLNGGKGGNGRIIPAPIGDEMTEKIQTLACSIFKEMDCKGVVRIDFLVDTETNDVYVNEINTIPGSLAFYLWEPKGVSYSALIDRMVEIAKRAMADKKANSYAYDSAILQKVNLGGSIKGAKGVKR